MDKAIITCALNGVLTNPTQHPVPVTPEEMAASARDAYNAGASIVHIHFRRQEPGMGHFPSWDPEVAAAASDAIREACPGIIINQTTGVIDEDVSGPLACLYRIKPEIAACNAGSLNYLKLKKDNTWAWPPMVFLNSVDKVQKMLDAMSETHTTAEMECFDVGIVRSVGLYLRAGMAKEMHYNFVMGVASGMPCDPELLELLMKYERRRTLASHAHRPRRDLGNPPASSRSRRNAANGRRGHVLPPERRKNHRQRAVDRSARSVCT
jgi:uncharacterized protein (DUF849 family)